MAETARDERQLPWEQLRFLLSSLLCAAYTLYILRKADGRKRALLPCFDEKIANYVGHFKRDPKKTPRYYFLFQKLNGFIF